MKAASWIDKLDDMLNPIVVKELRQAVKSRIVLAVLMLFLLVQLVILLLALSLGDRRSIAEANLQAGREIFMALQAILLGACLLLVPAYAGVRLAAEHSDTNVDLLFISTLRPRRIIAGKLQAAVVLILLIFSACAPFMTFTYLLRGIDIPSILLVLVLDFLVVLLCTQGAIFLGVVPTNLALKLFLGLSGLGLLTFVGGSMWGVSVELLDRGLGSLLDTVEFWLIAGSIAIAIVAVIGLLFTWSVAIVSPPSVNRALPVRLYLLGFWLVTGGAAALLTGYFRLLFPLYIWEGVVTVLLCAQILVSINEREQWGQRVRRTIPRRWWLRGPAFLTYSGAAGGVLFAVLLLALTLSLVSVPPDYWIHSLPASLETTFRRRYTLGFLLAALYTFDYCMLAVWLRYTLLQRLIKASYTWVLALLLLGLGLSVPFLLMFLFLSDEVRYANLTPWWQISNPLTTIWACVVDVGSDAESFRGSCIWLLSCLGLLSLQMCAPWMIRQLRGFRPPDHDLSFRANR